MHKDKSKKNNKVIKSFIVCTLTTVKSNLKSITKKKWKKKSLNTEH